MKYKLMDVASVIRSKNSGPFELTLDVLFRDEETFVRAVKADAINRRVITELYHIREEDVHSIISFPAARAIKATIVRPLPSGAFGERDVYGAQQHAPLMELEIELP